MPKPSISGRAHRYGPDDRQPANVALAPLRGPAQPILAAAGMLSRREPDPDSEVPPFGEGFHRRRRGGDRCGCHRAHSWDRHQSPCRVVCARAPAKLSVKARDLPANPAIWCSRKRARSRTAAGSMPSSPSMIAARRPTCAGPVGQLCPVCQMRAQGVDRLRGLANQKAPGSVGHRRGLLDLALHGHEPHGRARSRFRDRLGIGHVVLLPLHERLHIGRRDQPRLVAKPPIARAQ